MTPTQRTLAELRKLGYMAAVVEKWNPHARIRQDLFGIVDVVGIGPEGQWTEGGDDTQITVAVQATSGSNVASRITKLQASDALPRLLAAGWRVEVWGWLKSRPSGRYVLTRREVTVPVR